MDLSNLSPENILKQKELAHGIVYDDPLPPSPNPSQLTAEDRIEREIESLKFKKEEVLMESSLSRQMKKQAEPSPVKTDTGSILQTGWKNLPVTILPSEGFFYPSNTQIAIRAAEVKEIRHFSSIDETDVLDINNKLNLILSSCSVVKFGNQGVVSYKELKQEDRFFIVMAIRDLTFIKGENRIILKPQTGCGENKDCPFAAGVELRTGVLSRYKIPDKLMKYYSPADRKFIFEIPKLGKKLSLTVPSIGIMEIFSNYTNQRIQTGKEVDESFIKIAPYIYEDWRDLDVKKIEQLEKESMNWSKEEFSVYFEVVDQLKIGTKLEISLPCSKCGAEEVTARISFPRGFRSLFVISDIFGELL
ncbi:hypothetical protein EBS02_01185 [bacterium]|nr:hypothetical protein [bacterium]